MRLLLAVQEGQNGIRVSGDGNGCQEGAGMAKITLEFDMPKYPKIDSIFKRDTKTGAFLIGEYSTPEIEYLADNVWHFTEKIDGTNVRVGWDGEGVTFKGRTDKAQMPPELMAKLEELLPPAKLAQTFDCPAMLYGEGFGGKIQAGHKTYGDINFALFDVRIGRWWLKQGDVMQIAENLGIERVPDVASGDLDRAIEWTQEGFTSAFGDFPAEGLVCRPLVDLLARSGERIITKVKCKDWKTSR